jgi:hypothetical protein
VVLTSDGREVGMAELPPRRGSGDADPLKDVLRAGEVRLSWHADWMAQAHSAAQGEDCAQFQLQLTTQEGLVRIPCLIRPVVVPCFPLGYRLLMESSCMATLVEMGEDGNYTWKLDNSGTDNNIVWPAPNEASFNRRVFASAQVCYAAGTRLLLLSPEEGWVDATVSKRVQYNRHLMSVDGGAPEGREVDLNSFNHAWGPLDAEHFKRNTQRYKEAVAAEFSMVEDAITGNQLKVSEQLVNIAMSSSTEGAEEDGAEHQPSITTLLPRAFYHHLSSSCTLSSL